MELIKILQGLGSNEQSKRDDYLIELRSFLKNLPIIKSDELVERKNIYNRVWNCLFYSKFCLNYLIIFYFSIFHIIFRFLEY